MALLQEIASIIKNDVQKGLQGVGNFSFSTQQIEREVAIKRNALIKKYTANRLVNRNELKQDFNCIPVKCKDLSECCDIPIMTQTALRFELPRLSSVFSNESPIIYIGTIDRMRPFRVYTDDMFRYHRFNRATAKKPYVWINLGVVNENDTVYGYIFNLPLIKKISVSGIFEDPYGVVNCQCEDADELRFPAPEFMVDEIIQTLTYKFIQLYKPAMTVQNTQSPTNAV